VIGASEDAYWNPLHIQLSRGKRSGQIAAGPGVPDPRAIKGFHGFNQPFGSEITDVIVRETGERNSCDLQSSHVRGLGAEVERLLRAITPARLLGCKGALKIDEEAIGHKDHR
jgi:hypothetical protein